ncbi:MAG: helix-turn-helix domain-containing protein [Prevotella sp.]|nr:helix-turn-helix domain-containing protein [Prevotella sp.]
MAKMNLTPLSTMVDEVWGKKGTPRRDAMEEQLKEEVNSYYLGEAIRKARLAQNLTQDELGKRVGVQRSQICRLESGRTNITIPVMSRVFQALGIATATLDLGAAGKIALW